MDILYKRQTSDGKDVLIWRDGLVNEPEGGGFRIIKGIDKKKLSPRLLSLFAGAVQLYNLEDLWSLFQAFREVASSDVAPVLGDIRQRAVELQNSRPNPNPEPITAARKCLEHFIQADLDNPESYSDFIELAQNWLDGAETLAKQKKFDEEFIRYLKEAQNAVNHAESLISTMVAPLVVQAAPIGSVTHIFEELNKTLSIALDEGYEAIESSNINKAKKAMKELALVSRYIKALSALKQLPAQ